MDACKARTRNRPMGGLILIKVKLLALRYRSGVLIGRTNARVAAAVACLAATLESQGKKKRPNGVSQFNLTLLNVMCMYL